VKQADTGARHRLIEATAKLMRDEGYAAATSRRVAAEAGVKQALVYYYFPTMETCSSRCCAPAPTRHWSGCAPR
jgi:AcrR family transcriptional regulator